MMHFSFSDRSGCLFCLFGLFTLSFTWAPETRAQTFRIHCGVDSRGTAVYREVFEYDFVTTHPDFPGGDMKLLEYINSHRHYPENAYKAGIEGRVTCSFVVNCDGSISDVVVVRGVEPSLDTEAARLLSDMPKWNPGKMGGQPVAVRVIHTVPFRR